RQPWLTLAIGKPALGREQHAPRLGPAPRAGVAEALVCVVTNEPARGRVERAGLDERSVSSMVETDDGLGVMGGDLAEPGITGGRGGPEQERRRLQAVDAGLGVPDVRALLGLSAEGNELEGR